MPDSNKVAATDPASVSRGFSNRLFQMSNLGQCASGVPQAGR